jgi:hypothetical protein
VRRRRRQPRERTRETQYREVEVYISRALSFLSLSIQQLRHRPRNVYR